MPHTPDVRTIRHARRLRSQLLSGPPAPSATAAVAHLLAVQAQDRRGARLAVRARTVGVTARDVDSDLDDARLVIAWLLRGTLHLVCRNDLWWLHDLVAPRQRTGNDRRLREEGVDAAATVAGIDVIATSLADGPLTRAEIRRRLEDAGVPTAGQALVHLLYAAALEGLVTRGPVVAGGDQAFVLSEAWLGPRPAPLDRDEALARLAERYLVGHGPADAADLARWTGLPLRDCRAGLAALGHCHDQDTPPLPPPRLLGAFDPVLLGWATRTDVVGDHGGSIVAGGVFRPFALVRGRAAATWRLRSGRVEMQWLEDVTDDERGALDTEAEAVTAFLS